MSKEDESITAQFEALVYDGTVLTLTGQQADEKYSTGIDGPGVAFQGAGSWIKYTGIDFRNGIEEYEVLYSYPGALNTLSLRTGSETGEVFSTVGLSSGNWSNYIIAQQNVSNSPTGVQDLVLTQTDWLNFHWIRLYMPNDRASVEPADKAILQRTYDYALTLSTDGVVDSAKAYFEKVLAEAQAVLEDENATQEEGNTAWNNLLEGIWGLGIYQGDKTTLNLLIERAEAMTAETDRYVTENWDLLTAALEEAKEVAADGDALEEDITPAADALLDAILAQRYKADKSNLEDLITKTESMDFSGYTEESVAVLNRALAAAYTVLEDESLSIDDQAEVDNAVMNLEKAVAGLEKADSGEGGSEGGNTGDGSTDDGTGTGDDGSAADDTGNGNTGNNGGTSDDASKGNGSGAGNTSGGQSTGTETPKTGDGMNGAAAAAGMMALSAAAAMAVLRFRKRQ